MWSRIFFFPGLFNFICKTFFSHQLDLGLPSLNRTDQNNRPQTPSMRLDFFPPSPFAMALPSPVCVLGLKNLPVPYGWIHRGRRLSSAKQKHLPSLFGNLKEPSWILSLLVSRAAAHPPNKTWVWSQIHRSQIGVQARAPLQPRGSEHPSSWCESLYPQGRPEPQPSDVCCFFFFFSQSWAVASSKEVQVLIQCVLCGLFCAELCLVPTYGGPGFVTLLKAG